MLLLLSFVLLDITFILGTAPIFMYFFLNFGPHLRSLKQIWPAKSETEQEPKPCSSLVTSLDMEQFEALQMYLKIPTHIQDRFGVWVALFHHILTCRNILLSTFLFGLPETNS